MERITIVLLVLGFANLLLWGVNGPTAPDPALESARARVASLEKEITVLEATQAQGKRLRGFLESPPEERAPEFSNRLQMLGKSAGFVFQETSQSGTNPAMVRLSGHGTYRSVAQLLNHAAINPAVIVNGIRLSLRDDDRIDAVIELAVRSGAWSGNPDSREPVEPVVDTSRSPVLGKAALFGQPAPSEKPAVQRPDIRYLGYYSGKGLPTGIIEEHLKTMLVQPGDRTPTGLHVQSIDPDGMVVRAAGEKGNAWVIPLEISH
ncbi:MAG TPA: hypothetical protein VIV61_06050 [Candidatus Ozemobacteraceae bacterium]